MTALYSAVVDADGELRAGSSGAIVPFWSFTKTLLAVCAASMAGQRAIDLDERLPGANYTLRHLLQHRAGLCDYGGLPAYHEAVARDEEPWTDDELIERTNANALMFAPGSSFAYSNIGYLILRRHLEHTARTSLGELMNTFVFAPFQLNDCRVATTRTDMRATVFGEHLSYHPGWVYHGLVIGPVSAAALALHRVLTWDVLPATLRDELLRGEFVGTDLPGRPWQRAEYGLGTMTGEWKRCDDDESPPAHSRSGVLRVAGHGAGGPGSTGSVFARLSGVWTTVAVFSDAEDGAIPEWEVRRLMCAHRLIGAEGGAG